MAITAQVHPQALLRRSPLYRYHLEHQAEFVARSGSAVVDSYNGNLQREIERAESLAIIDLCGIPRIGFKGADTADWLRQQGVTMPTQPNSACQTEQGITVARLSQNEFLILDSVAEPGAKIAEAGLEIAQLETDWSMNLAQRTYLLPRADSHAWLALTGAFASQVLSKICAVDMRLHKFAQHSVAQTSVARSNAIVVRADQGSTPCFFVLADLSTAEFLWHGLLDAMDEFQGKPIGLNAFFSLRA